VGDVGGHRALADTGLAGDHHEPERPLAVAAEQRGLDRP
jgi:hypothetical protein